MFVFQVFASPETEKNEPQKIWSVGAIQKATGIGCSEQIARQLLKNTNSSEMKQKIREVKSSLTAIAKAAGYGTASAFSALENDKVAELFVKYPARFVEIAKAAGWNAVDAFSALENDKVAELFVKYPARFVEIAKATGRRAGYAFSALGNDKVAELFVKYPDRFVEIAKATGRNAEYALNALENDKIAGFFVKDPEKVVRSFADISKAAGWNVINPYIFSALGNDKVAELFVKYPDRFVEIAKATGWNAVSAFSALKNDKIAGFFVKDPEKVVRSFADISKAAGHNTDAFAFLRNDKVAKLFVNYNASFVEIAKAAGQNAGYALNALGNDKVAELFVRYARGQLKIEQFLVNTYSFNDAAIEVGWLLDYLHEEPAKRKAYLDQLSTTHVLGLLLSDPEYFYTSSNHMLFDRLKKDIGNRNLSDVFAEYGIEPESIRNFMFRAINYGRFCGRADCLFSESDISRMMGITLEPINSAKFDNKYYFLLANAIEDIMTMPNVLRPIRQTIESKLNELNQIPPLLRSTDTEQTILALNYILWKIDSSTLLVPEDQKAKMHSMDEKAYYEPSNYRGNDGKVTIVQVFKKSDTEKNHWPLTQAWVNKYGKPKTGNDGELTYETKSARIILYIGDDDNQKFVAAQLKKQPNSIITFRGHSYSLQGSFPYEIFGNSDSHLLFIPGSCGSAGSTPEYLTKNPNTDIRFFSNTSTGRGQVTNALIDAILATTKRTAFADIIKKSGIEKYGGDPATIKVWSSGEALLKYVYGK